MHPSKLSRGELVAVIGGLALAAGVFVQKTYETNPANKNANVNSMVGDFSIWQVHPILRWLLLVAAVAPLILAYIVVRDFALSWPRGQVTSLVAIVALALLLYNGWISRPGQPSGEVSLGWSWYLALVGTLLMLAGSFRRQAETEAVRKPPGMV